MGFSTPLAAASLVSAIVTDPLTGIAIDGYDPVSYFTEPEPLPGRADHVYSWGGVPWYFASAANRDAFMRAPEIYAPQYGGHCAMSLARGYLTEGKPGFYVISRAQLYLFHSAANREAFLMSPERARAEMAAQWPRLSARFARPGPGAPDSN